MERSQEKTHIVASLVLFETSRQATVIARSHADFGHSIRPNRPTFSKLPEAVSDKKEEEAHTPAIFIHALIAD